MIQYHQSYTEQNTPFSLSEACFNFHRTKAFKEPDDAGVLGSENQIVLRPRFGSEYAAGWAFNTSALQKKPLSYFVMYEYEQVRNVIVQF